MFLIEGAYKSSKIGGFISSSTVSALSIEARKLRAYKKLIKVLEDSTLFYAEVTGSILTAS